VGSRNAENDRTVASVQVRRRSVHSAIETVQGEGSGGESALETPGAVTAVGWG
jgi:hypothetical protein